MLGQLHAYYIIFHAFTVDFMQLQALHASSVGPWDFEWPYTVLPLTSFQSSHDRIRESLDSLGTSAANTPGTDAQQTPAWTAGGVHIR